jgi:ribosome-binding ATPase
MLQLLTAKPVLYVCNVEEASAATGNALSARVAEMAAGAGRRACGDLGPDRGGTGAASRRRGAEFLTEMGLAEPGLDRLIRAGYDASGPADLFHRRPEGGARLDHPRGTPPRRPRA